MENTFRAFSVGGFTFWRFERGDMEWDIRRVGKICKGGCQELKKKIGLRLSRSGEMADTLVLEASALGRGGSSPSCGTIQKSNKNKCLCYV